MIELDKDLLFELGIIDNEDIPETINLYNYTLQENEITITDYLLIRDLKKLSGYKDLCFHYILILLIQSLRNGSVCLPIQEEIIASFLKDIMPSPSVSPREIIASVHKYNKLITPVKNDPKNINEIPGTPIILNESGTTPRLYFQKYYIHERICEFHLLKRLNKSRNDKFRESFKDLSQLIFEKHPLLINKLPVEFNAEQVAAIFMPLFYSLTVISGGPGTGKTTVAVNIIRLFLQTGISIQDIRLTAPTGKAAQRLTEAVHKGIQTIKKPLPDDSEIMSLEATTLHRMLSYSTSSGKYLHHERNPVNAKLIIADEVSMIDCILMANFLSAVPEDCVLVLIGDRFQLPSVSAGAVFANIIPEINKYCDTPVMNIISRNHKPASLSEGSKASGFTDERFIQLSKNYRSIQDIAICSEKLRKGDLAFYTGPGIMQTTEESVLENILSENGNSLPISLISYKDAREINKKFLNILNVLAFQIFQKKIKTSRNYAEIIESLINKPDPYSQDPSIDKDVSEAFSILAHLKILGPSRKGRFGLNRINLFMSDYLSNLCDPGGSGIVYSGSHIIILKNDYNHNLFNGDTGIIIRNHACGNIAFFKRPDGSVLKIPVSALPPYDHAFALTVHKSQGTEYDTVFISLPPETPEKLCTREMLYTALTRAKKRCILFTNTDQLKLCASQITERFSSIQLNSDNIISGE